MGSAAETGKRRVLILGAGYAGLAAVHQLERASRRHLVTLVDQNAYHTLETKLHEAAAHAARATIPLEPILERTGVRFYPARIERVDLDARRVRTSAGTLEYDLLLAALGSTTNFFRIPGLAEHALELKSVEDANAIHQWLLRAYHPQGGKGSRDVLIGGAGLTGVELATELAVRAQRLARAERVEPGTVWLVEAGPSVLPDLAPDQRERALRALRERGVRVRTGSRVVSAAAGALELEGGERLEGGLIVWTGGVRAQDLVTAERAQRGPGDRLVVGRTLELPGYPGAFAAGDAALALDRDGQPVPPTAQHAAQQGRVAGRNLRARLEGGALEAYTPSTLGELVSLGGLLGVGWVRLGWGARLRLAGHLAGVVKRASEWRHLQEARGGPRL